MVNKEFKISIVGTGNIAFHLGKRCRKKGVSVVEIIGRNEVETISLSQLLDATANLSIKDLNPNIDLLILAIQDDVIQAVAKQLPEGFNPIVLHTSGSVRIDALQSCFNFGVFYPLQSFHKSRKAKWKKIPILFNGSSSKVVQNLQEFAEVLALKSFHVSDDQKFKTHAAAVVVNNFVSYLNIAVREFLNQEKIDIEVLMPLMEETCRRCLNKNEPIPLTGPAVRDDQNIIQSHIELLSEYTDLQDIYAHISSSILEYSGYKKI